MVERRDGAPFYRIEQFGAQCRVHINTAHRFYSDLYAAPDSTPRVQSALEVLLFVFGQCELSSDGEIEMFYRSEIYEWSRRLDLSLNRLDDVDPAGDALDANAAVAELAEA